MAELAGNLPVSVALGDCLPLVEGPPAARQGDLHLRPAVLEVQRERHEAHASVAQLRDDLVDLAAVHEQLAGPPGLVEGAGAVAAVRMLGDVQAVEHQLAVVLLNERSDQRGVAGPQGLHLVADQDYPGLVGLENLVVTPDPLIGGDGPAACFPGRGDLLVISPTRYAAPRPRRRDRHRNGTGELLAGVPSGALGSMLLPGSEPVGGPRRVERRDGLGWQFDASRGSVFLQVSDRGRARD